MHGFEALIAEILEDEGYWIRRSYKVALTREEKQKIGRPSSPRWEIDIVAFRAPDNHVLAVECKSFLDSTGVVLSDLQGGRYARTYKLFTECVLREVVLNRLALQLVEQRLCAAPPRVSLALAAGKIKGDPNLVRQFCEGQDWLLFDAQWIREKLRRVSEGGYTNSVAAMVAKLLLRGEPGADEASGGE
jgi:hypothetical protein